MIGIIGSFLVVFLVAGGGLIQSGNTWAGLGIVGLSAIVLGAMFASLQSASDLTGAIEDGLEANDNGLTIHQLVSYIVFSGADGSTKIYLGDQGLNVASGVFTCMLDGQQAIVIERKAE